MLNLATAFFLTVLIAASTLGIAQILFLLFAVLAMEPFLFTLIRKTDVPGPVPKLSAIHPQEIS